MFDFNNSQNLSNKCGLVIDIGSGSVGAAIVVSDNTRSNPEIIWSNRQFVLIKDSENLNMSLKQILTTIVNICLEIGGNGIKSLHQYNQSMTITSVQVTMRAPWTYTIIKNIHFQDDNPFDVNEYFIENLSKIATKHSTNFVEENKIFHENHLEVIDTQTTGITINGYTVRHPKNINTSEVSITHITAITHQKIFNILTDSIDKILPNVTIKTHSFMYVYYDVMKHIKPDISEVCLIDITSEATEIGIIRDGILTYVSHVTFGAFSIAREIAQACNIPKEEAYIYMKDDASITESNLSKKTKKELCVILESYEKQISDLFKNTGDALAVPNTLFLNCNTETEAFFLTRVQNASKKSTGLIHKTHLLSPGLFEDRDIKDSSLLLSLYYFNRRWDIRLVTK